MYQSETVHFIGGVKKVYAVIKESMEWKALK
jgi:hypothetical protein